MTPDQRYTAMLGVLRRGGKMSAPAIDEICRSAGKKAADVVFALHVARTTNPQPGDDCEKCGSALVVLTSRRIGERRRQFIGCTRCGSKAGSRLVPDDTVQHRNRTA